MGLARQESARVVLSILLLIMDYIWTLQMLKGRAYDKKSARASGVVVAVLFLFAGTAFGCMSFMMRSSLCMLWLCLIATVFLAAAGGAHFLTENRKSLQKRGLTCLLLSLLLILGATLLMRDGSQDTSVCMELLIFGRNGSSAYWWRHGLLNAVLFLPFGGSLVLLSGRKKLTPLQGTMTGMMVSTVIELIQLVLQLGQCDINDILFNTLGTAAGFLCAEWFLKMNSVNSNPGEKA